MFGLVTFDIQGLIPAEYDAICVDHQNAFKG